MTQEKKTPQRKATAEEKLESVFLAQLAKSMPGVTFREFPMKLEAEPESLTGLERWHHGK